MTQKFTFIDLFAGIGGFHLAMHRLGGKCVFASEIDSDARKTYEYNHKKNSPELFSGKFFNNDIRNISSQNIPDFDVLCAGFPCQPFSQAGYKRGFNDNHNSERGNLFFNIAEIIEAKKPKAFFLENVRGLVNHDNGKTFAIIRDILETELGYSFYFKIVYASDYGLPQLRPRVFIVGFRNDTELLRGFNFPEKTPLKFTMSDVWNGECGRDIGFTIRVGGRGSNIDDRRNWDAYLVDGEVRKLSYKEARKMQGFPDDFHFPVSDTQAMKQLGNSVAVDAVDAVEAIGRNLIIYMNNLDLRIPNNDFSRRNNEGFGIKSYLGAKPTLLNALGNTNFIFRIDGLSADKIDEINSIDTATKLRDRIIAIEQYGGSFHYVNAEKEAMTYNLKMVDSLMPEIILHILLAFCKNRISSISKIVDFIDEQALLNAQIHYGDKLVLRNKVQKLLVDVLLGFFAGTKWDGAYQANGSIVMKNSGDCVAFHIIDLESLKMYLYENIKLDTPSTTRHRFGNLFVEKDGTLYFKLNLQLRF